MTAAIEKTKAAWYAELLKRALADSDDVGEALLTADMAFSIQPEPDGPLSDDFPEELIEVPDIRQEDHYSCGAAASMCVGRYFGVGPRTLNQWKKTLGTDVEESTHPQEIIDCFEELGMEVDAHDNMTIEDLKDYWRRGMPVICPVQDYGPEVPKGARFPYGHYLTVIGVAMGYVFCQDSSEDNVIAGSESIQKPGRIIISENDWLKAWHDRDVKGNKFVRFGIAIGPKQSIEFSWTPFRGKQGGQGWRSSKTGEIRYQPNRPSEREEGQQQQPQQRQPQQQDPIQQIPNVPPEQVATTPPGKDMPLNDPPKLVQQKEPQEANVQGPEAIVSFYERASSLNDQEVMTINNTIDRASRPELISALGKMGIVFPRSVSREKLAQQAKKVIADRRNIAIRSRLLNPKGFSLDAYFARDIFNRRAQGILNRALEQSKDISAKAKKELLTAINIENPGEMSRKVMEFVERYRSRLSELLGATNVAALMAGASEVAGRMPSIPPAGVLPPLPPTLPPEDASAIVDELKYLTPSEQEQRIYELKPEHQEFIRSSLRNESGIPQAPSFEIPQATQEVGKAVFPAIEEAVSELNSKNLVTRQEFNRLDDAARSKAFTVTGVDAKETLGKIRDELAKNLEEGTDYETFRENVLKAVDEGTFLSEGHLENVFRTNIQAAFSDGQMNVLSHPFVRGGFPYAGYSAIHDSRVRHNHLELEKLGIEGTNIYRIDDPVFKKFRPPWDFNDRCSWVPMTIRLAAEQGLNEAKKWLETGVEPSPPAYVTQPPFNPPPGFVRMGIPMSIQLSMDSIENWISKDA